MGNRRETDTYEEGRQKGDKNKTRKGGEGDRQKKETGR